MKNEFDIGNYLKNLRNEKRFSTRDLTEDAGLSYSFISAIENGRKKNPTVKQISNILKSIVENNHAEFNFHSEQINYLSKGEIDLGKYVDAKSSIMKTALEDVKSRYVTKIHTHNGNYYDFPVNDLKYHLTFKNDPSFYGRILLDEDDKKRINEMIINFLNDKYENSIKQLYELKSREVISQEDFRELTEEIKNMQRFISFGDQNGKL